MEGDDGDVVGCILDGESRERLGVKREKRIDLPETGMEMP